MGTRETLLFRDGRGDLYLLPCEMLEQLRVPRERRTEVEQSIAAVDIVGLGYPTSPVPPRPSTAEPFHGLQLLGQWPVPAVFTPAIRSE